MPQTILTHLQEQEAAVKKRLAEETKKLKAIQAKQRAEARRLRRAQWQAVGQLVDELGLPMDLGALRQTLGALIASADIPHGEDPLIQALTDLAIGAEPWTRPRQREVARRGSSVPPPEDTEQQKGVYDTA
jgi:hypothetical protein